MGDTPGIIGLDTQYRARSRPSRDRSSEAVAGAPANAGWGTAARVVALACLYAIPLVAAITPVVDLDIWWHLRTGEWVVEHGRVPATDPFSRYGQDQPWVAYSWLFEVLVYGAYRAFGLCGILAFRVLLVAGVAMAVQRLVAKREPRFGLAVALAAAGLYALTPVVSERPWLFTILFFTLTVDAVLDLRAGRRSRTAWLLPVLYVLWANIHIQFVYGLFVLALACVMPLVDRVARWGDEAGNGDTAGSACWWQTVAISTSCLVATLLNPYHARLYAIVRDLAMQPAPYRLVVEHLAMAFRTPAHWAVLALAAAAVFTLGRRSRLSSFEVILLATAAYFSFHTQRDAWFVVVASLAILVADRRAVPDVPRLRPLGILASAVLIAAVVGPIGWKLGSFTEEGHHRAIAAKFPVDAVAVVEQRGYPGPLYNDFNWGGYLIWALRRLPVAIDGRTNLHGDPRLLRFNDTYLGNHGWESDPDLAAARLVIWDAKAPLASLLRLDHRFILVYEDRVAIVFVRSDAPLTALR